jgi:hypothetical protein
LNGTALYALARRHHAQPRAIVGDDHIRLIAVPEDLQGCGIMTLSLFCDQILFRPVGFLAQINFHNSITGFVLAS